MKKRIIGLDILRVLGIISIFCYHFTDSFISAGGTGRYTSNAFTFFSIMSRPASLLLFLISGFALMYNSEDILSLKKYYLRRFKGLYIPFYVAYVLMLGIGVITLKWAPWQFLPRRRYIYTLLGIDGLVSNYIPNFYLIGEWFMSCIVICYLLFPVLGWLSKHAKYITLFVLVGIYVVLAYVNNPFAMPVYTNPLFIILYFYVGMLMQGLVKEKELHGVLVSISRLISIASFIYFFIDAFFSSDLIMKLGNNGLELLYFIWSISLFMTFLTIDLSKASTFYKSIKYLSGISWYLILVHHVFAIIYFNLHGLSNIWIIDFIFILVISLFLAEVVKIISTYIKKIIK